MKELAVAIGWLGFAIVIVGASIQFIEWRKLNKRGAISKSNGTETRALTDIPKLADALKSLPTSLQFTVIGIALLVVAGELAK